MKALKQRLSLIASMVIGGRSVCDVGTDHGYLPAFLFLEGISQNITATDIREKPLENARENLERLGADKVKLLLCDGLAGVSRESGDNVIIAGMGGEVISGIIQRTPWLKDGSVNLILQPMTAARELRLFLASSGFEVIREEAVADGRKIYSVMQVRFCGQSKEIGCVQEHIGLLKPDSAEAISYIQKQLYICEKALAQMGALAEKNEEYKQKWVLSEKLREILEKENGS